MCTGPTPSANVHWISSEPARGTRTELPADTQPRWLGSQRGLAEGVGEWTFYATTLLIVLALVKCFPYHWFARTSESRWPPWRWCSTRSC